MKWPFLCWWADAGLRLLRDSSPFDPVDSWSSKTMGCVQQANLVLLLGSGGRLVVVVLLLLWASCCSCCCCAGLCRCSPRGLGVRTARARSFRAERRMGMPAAVMGGAFSFTAAGKLLSTAMLQLLSQRLVMGCKQCNQKQ